MDAQIGVLVSGKGGPRAPGKFSPLARLHHNQDPRAPVGGHVGTSPGRGCEASEYVDTTAAGGLTQCWCLRSLKTGAARGRATDSPIGPTGHSAARAEPLGHLVGGSTGFEAEVTSEVSPRLQIGAASLWQARGSGGAGGPAKLENASKASSVGDASDGRGSVGSTPRRARSSGTR
jgi:hypothetical protein